MNAFRTLGFVIFSILGVAACGKQSEGERCDQDYGGDNDCEDGLICVSKDSLKGEADRCCPAEGASYSDARCKRFTDTVTDDTFGTGGSGATDGTGGAGGAAAGGSAGASGSGGGVPTEPVTVECRYTSDCEAPLVCGPTGICQPECVSDRDCRAPLVCDASDTHTCVEPTE